MPEILSGEGVDQACFARSRAAGDDVKVVGHSLQTFRVEHNTVKRISEEDGSRR